MTSGCVFLLLLCPIVHGFTLVQNPILDRAQMEEVQSFKLDSQETWKHIEDVMMALESQNTTDPDTEQSILNQQRIALLRNLKPCAQCHSPKRYGEVYDGGYVMCSELLEEGRVSAGYSLGISGYDAWGRDISSSLHVPVYQFDCTNSNRPDCEGGDCHFYDLCITANETRTETKPQYKTMLELMALNGHGKRGDVKDLVLQLDVESYEWDLFADPSTAEQMSEFSQISVEFHGLIGKAGCCAASVIWTKLKALENLNRMFVVTHLHGNNFEGTTEIQDTKTGKYFSVPAVLEVLYVRRGLLEEQQCLTDPHYLPEDHPNNPHAAEINPPHLPEYKKH